MEGTYNVEYRTYSHNFLQPPYRRWPALEGRASYRLYPRRTRSVDCEHHARKSIAGSEWRARNPSSSGPYNVFRDPPQQRIQHLRGLLLREQVAIVRFRVDRLGHGQERLFHKASSAPTCMLWSRHALLEDPGAFREIGSWSRNGSLLLRNICAVSWQMLSSWVAAQAKGWKVALSL